MNRIFLNVMIFSAILVLFSGCSTSGLNVGNILKKNNASTPVVAADNIFAMPKDASRVVLAISAKIINSDKEIKDIMFQSDASVELPQANLFNFSNAVLLSYDRGRKNLKAELYFSDTLGRTCAYTVEASYLINNNKIVIQKYDAIQKFTTPENAVCFIFPADEYRKLTKNTFPKSFYDLYRYAASRAVTPQQALQYKDKMKWTVMVFVLDRMAKSADMKLELSDKTGASDKGYGAYSKYIIYEGWRVGVVTGNFHLLAPDSTMPLYAKVYSRSGNLFVKRKMFGLYELR